MPVAALLIIGFVMFMILDKTPAIVNITPSPPEPPAPPTPPAPHELTHGEKVQKIQIEISTAWSLLTDAERSSILKSFALQEAMVAAACLTLGYNVWDFTPTEFSPFD